MTPEAELILGVFRERGLRAGGRIRPADFGDAIVWEGGFVRDESVLDALAYLFSEGFLLEHAEALELTERGATYLQAMAQPTHGARVYRIGSTFLVKQTVLRGTPAEYVIEEHRERHVRDDDAAIAQAIRDATRGRL